MEQEEYRRSSSNLSGQDIENNIEQKQEDTFNNTEMQNEPEREGTFNQETKSLLKFFTQSS